MKKYIKYFYIILIFIAIFCFYIFIPKEEAEVLPQTLDIKNEELKMDESSVFDKYYVDIKGEVKKPGVYEVDKDSRVIDVINIAGGLTKNADTSILNLSKKINDEMNIKIYSKKEINAAKELIEPKTIEVIKEVEKIVEKECNCPINPICDNTNAYIEDKDNVHIQTSNNIENKDNVYKQDDKAIESSTNQIIEDVKINKVSINIATKEELMSIPGIGESKANLIIEYRNTSKFNSIEDIKNVKGIGDSLFEKIKEFITI